MQRYVWHLIDLIEDLFSLKASLTARGNYSDIAIYFISFEDLSTKPKDISERRLRAKLSLSIQGINNN